jgi:hypothetical protein
VNIQLHLYGIVKPLEIVYQKYFNGVGFELQNRWFKRLILLFLIYKCLHWNYYFDFLLSDDSTLFGGYRSIGSFKDLAFLLLKFPASWLARLFVTAVFVLSVYRLFFTTHFFFPAFLADFLIWFLVLNLNNKMYAGLSGGNLLLNQFLLMNCFLNKSPLSAGTVWNDLRNIFQGLAVLGIQAQVMLLYFLSAWCKLGYTEWLGGTALNSILEIDHFSLTGHSNPGFVFEFLMLLLNYVIVAYQLFFPLLVWFRRISKYFLLIGIAMHVFIGLFMGLPDFAMIMLLGYIYFWPYRVSNS